MTLALEDHLNKLKDIKGYIASGILSTNGEMLVQDSADSSFDLAMVGAAFTDIFSSAQEASSKIGLDSTRELFIETPKGNIMIFSACLDCGICSGTRCPAKFRLIGVVAHQGNEALMDMQMKKLLRPITDELS